MMWLEGLSPKLDQVHSGECSTFAMTSANVSKDILVFFSDEDDKL